MRLEFGLHVRPAADDVDRRSEKPLDETADAGKTHDINAARGVDIHHDIYVAVGPVFHAGDGAEDGEADNTLRLEFGLRFLQCTEDMGEAASVLRTVRQS